MLLVIFKLIMEGKQLIKQKLDYLRDSPFKTIIYGVSGSVAAIKAKEISLALL